MIRNISLYYEFIPKMIKKINQRFLRKCLPNFKFQELVCGIITKVTQRINTFNILF